ncbi:Cytochrome P450 76C2 [Dichanthelium oligosanthes]|uniref:Cytochrome P450 76C2 n=1 Tax=Dichanthelium oligosanthes TaxID=888268 RepID=A0A1E5UP76_9POAL|nr:Cytochrome P450 76C2 [Dichanthelium oligosanthes]
MASFIVECVGWLIIALFSLYIFQLLRDARQRLPPGPWPPKPLIGDLLDLGEPGQQHRTFARLAERYGGLMSLRFGLVPHVIVSTPDALRAVFCAGEGGKKVDNIAGIPSLDVLTAWGHDAHTIFALPSQDDKWRAVRKFAAAEMLAPRRIAGAGALMQTRIVEALHRDLSGHAARGTAVAIRNVVMDPILSLLLGVLYSTDLEAKERAMFRDVIEEIVELLGTGNVSDMFPPIAALDLQGLRRRMKSLLAVVYRPFDEEVVVRRRSREAGEPRKNDVLDIVLDKESEWKEEGSLLNPEDIYGAGASSTAALMEWAMVDLIQNPDVMRKAKEELTRVLGDKPLMEDGDVARLPYLQAVIKELLRLRVALPLMPRKAEADIEVNGHRIPKGTNVLVNAWAINRNAEAWPEPEKFIPERFLGGETRSYLGQDFDMIPFGLGRRICPGMPYALKMIPLILGTLLHRFEWELPAEVQETGIDMTEKCGVVLTLVTPLKAIPKEI